jgi:hypothetical protein
MLDINERIEANRRQLERCRALLRNAPNGRRRAGLQNQIRGLEKEQARLSKERSG